MPRRVRWELLDERAFADLVAHLLSRKGFVEIDVQGEGADGGLDILATEMVEFSFRGARPVRWGIQCKFSVPTGRRQVSESEIRDVEGVLRSDRFSRHDLGGYMLITNRRVSQNLTERLRGIDQQTQFRTAIVDGHALEAHMAEEPEVAAVYFDRVLEEIHRLATEQGAERAAEDCGLSDLSFVLDESEHEPKPVTFDGDLSGIFASAEGELELHHDQATGRVCGEYSWNSAAPVGDLEGTLDVGVIRYRFRWRQQDLKGSGFHLVSPDGRRLEGLWILGETEDDLELGDLLKVGRRKSYWRTGERWT